MDIYFKSISMSCIAFIFTILILILYINKRKTNDMNERIFLGLLICTIIINILELINPLTIMYRNQISLINDIVSKIYFGTLIIWGTMFIIYINIIIFKNKNTFKEIITSPLVIISTLISIISYIIIIKGNIEYSGGSGNMPYVSTGLILYFIYGYLLLGTLTILTMLSVHRERIKNINLTPTNIALVLFIITVLIQIFTNYEINELSLYCTIIITICYLTIENQDFKLLTLYKESKQKADKANKDKTLFLMKISHEIRTPMNIIIGYSQALLGDNNISREKITNDIKNVLDASNSLTELIDIIIEMSKLEKNELVLKEDNYYLENIIFEINSIMPTKIKDPNVSFKIDVNPNIPKEIYGDAYKLFKIIEYMILNTIKYTKEGEILLSFDGIKKENEEYELKVLISSNSNKEIIDNYNDDFINFVDNSIRNETRLDNVKLGVIIAKELIRIINGNINISVTEENKITTEITLNQKVIGDTLIGNLFDKIDINHEDDLIDLTGKKILVVDDGEINLIMTKKSLSQFHASVTSAKSGKECVELIKNNKFDLIFLDQYMPEMDGIATVHALTLTGYKIPPIIALTANTYDSLKNDYSKYGFSDYLHKPIVIKELNRILKKYFETK